MAFYRRIDFARQDWVSWVGGVLAVTLALALLAAVLLVSLGIALVLLPFVVVAVLIGRWRWRKLMAEAERQTDPQRGGSTIETDYHIVDRRTGGEGDSR